MATLGVGMGKSQQGQLYGNYETAIKGFRPGTNIREMWTNGAGVNESALGDYVTGSPMYTVSAKDSSTATTSYMASSLK